MQLVGHADASVAGDGDVVEIAAADTHVLRRAVLREGDPNRLVEFPEDAMPETVHLGIRASGRLVATSSWTPKPCAEMPGPRAVQLRGMATDSTLQGAGLGGRLLEAAVARFTDAGYDMIWARARDSALGFYAKHGCRIVGEGFVDGATGLPHHIVVRDLR
jgi:GNAT superfamily N-acetyltransferase